MTPRPSVSDFACHRLAFRNSPIRPHASKLITQRGWPLADFSFVGGLNALVDSILNPLRDDVLRTPTSR